MWKSINRPSGVVLDPGGVEVSSGEVLDPGEAAGSSGVVPDPGGLHSFWGEKRFTKC